METIEKHIKDWMHGNEMAFKPIFDNYYPYLLSFTSKQVPLQEDAEEIVMNAFLKLWQNKHRIVGFHNLKKYLFGILRQELAAHARKKITIHKTLDEVPLQNLGTVNHPEYAMKDLQYHYQVAISKLTDKQRDIYIMSRHAHLSQQEISEQTGLSIHTVNNHISSAMKVIRNEMKDYPEVIVMIITSELVCLSLLQI